MINKRLNRLPANNKAETNNTIIGPMLLNSSAHVDDVLDVVDGHGIDDILNVLAYIGVIDSLQQHELA